MTWRCDRSPELRGRRMQIEDPFAPAAGERRLAPRPCQFTTPDEPTWNGNAELAQRRQGRPSLGAGGSLFQSADEFSELCEQLIGWNRQRGAVDRARFGCDDPDDVRFHIRTREVGLLGRYRNAGLVPRGGRCRDADYTGNGIGAEINGLTDILRDGVQ